MPKRYQQFMFNLSKWILMLIAIPLAIGGAVAAVTIPYPDNFWIGMMYTFTILFCVEIAKRVSKLQNRQARADSRSLKSDF